LLPKNWTAGVFPEPVADTTSETTCGVFLSTRAFSWAWTVSVYLRSIRCESFFHI
jgi:hypothetical protein